MLLPPIISASLPAPPGPHQVSLAFLTLPSSTPFSHPFPLLKSTKQPAFQVRQIGYSVFYPCAAAGPDGQKAGKKGVRWVPDPVWDVVEGYRKFMGSKGGATQWAIAPLGYIAGRLQMPVYNNAPLGAPKQPHQKYPLVIFSHGLAGTRQTYSQFCSAIASEGYVVLSIEHRDGSGPVVQLPLEDGDGCRKPMYYIGVNDIEWKEGEEQPVTHARTLQLEIRTREVYETFQSFQKLVSATGDDSVQVHGLEGEARKEWVESFMEKVDFQDLRLTGHSFGGGTILHLLQTPPPPCYSPLPTTRAIALDPWLDPLPAPSDIDDPSSSSSFPPLLVINSPGFTEWTDHWERLLRLVRGKGSLVTMMGIGHQWFSDFTLLSPTGYSTAHHCLSQIHSLSTSFFHDRLAADPAVVDKQPDGGDFVKDHDGVKIGKKGMKAGDVLLHLLDA